MNFRLAKRLWMAWSLVLLAAMAGALWVSTRATPSFDSQETLAPLRGGIEDLEAAKARIEALSTALEGNAEEVSRLAQRQLPRSPFGLVEPPFVQEMRKREDGLLAALTGIRDQLRESKQRLVELQQEVTTIESSMQSDLDEIGHQIGLLKEELDAKRIYSGFALAILGAIAALSIVFLARRMDGRKPPIDHGEAKA